MPVLIGLVEALIEAVDGEGILPLMPQLGVGDAVCITSGPFNNRLAVMEVLHSADRVRVLLEIMNQALGVELNVHDVRESDGVGARHCHEGVTRLWTCANRA